MVVVINLVVFLRPFTILRRLVKSKDYFKMRIINDVKTLIRNDFGEGKNV